MCFAAHVLKKQQNHRVELALKDPLLKEARFKGVKKFMTDLFYLLKQSGKIRTTLGVQAYTTPKVHGTRFVNHVNLGLDRLLCNWPVLTQALEIAIELPNTRNRPKLKNFVKKLKDYSFLFTCSLMKQILDKISQLSLLLKSEIKTYGIQPVNQDEKCRHVRG